MSLNKYKIIKFLILAVAALFIISNAVLISIDVIFVPDLDLVKPGDYSMNPDKSGRYTIDLNMQNGYFSIKDNLSEVTYSGYPLEIESDEEMREPSKNRIRSFMEVNLLDTKTRTVTTVNTTQHSVDNSGLTVESTETGFLLEYSFMGGDIIIPVEISTAENGFSVVIDPTNIVETPDTNVLDITLLPFFISADTDSSKEGDLFIPDGSGALIDFQSDIPQHITYLQKVYEYDLSVLKETQVLKSQGIRFPVFGSITDSKIVMGVISKGAADSYIAANTDGERTSYINVCPRFTLRARDRIVYDDNRSPVDIFQRTPIYLEKIRIDYYLHSGEELTYVDMAHIYRDYLIKRYGLDNSLVYKEEKPLFVDIYGSTIKKRQYFGIPLDSVYRLTTYSQAEEMLSRLKEGNVNTAIVQYNNFTKETVWGETPRSVTPLFQLGGKRGLDRLLNTVSELGYSIYGAVNISEYYSGSSVFSNIYEAAKNMRQEPIRIFNFKPNTYTVDESDIGRYFVRNSRIVPHIKEYSDKFSDFDMGMAVKGHWNLYRDYSNDKPSLEFTMNSMVSSINEIEKNKIPIVTNGGYEYELEFSQAVFNMPSSGSLYDISYMDIPFYQIALHGLVQYSLEPVNSSQNIQYSFLRSLETGASLQYRWTYEPSDTVRYSRDSHLIYTHFELWIDDAIKKHNKLNEVLGKVSREKIVNHENIGKSVFATTYGNGTKVVVNYSDKDFESSYGTIPSMGYVFIQEENG